ncbi:MAG: AmmeMemoRadiSam system radical SAM enzyme, partial [Deltaproteobacteria bacterium]|nr:AmmeMemoRadiSam system radical SAM enzyme [Deltaproteobacteria bacterium]
MSGTPLRKRRRSASPGPPSGNRRRGPVNEREVLEPGVIRGEWFHALENGRIQCDLCPRFCQLREGQRGFCFVRQNRDGGIALTSYGRASGFCIDPIEKKPLNHFYPGTSVLSFGTAGCNLGCRFCQNWDISKAREMDRLTDLAGPRDIVDAAVRAGCRSIAYTYNDPVVFAEYAIDTAEEARKRGLMNVAVTAGYITKEARPAFFEHLDAVNIDLKAFTERFYKKLCFAELA